jgi:hypothetical protein
MIKIGCGCVFIVCVYDIRTKVSLGVAFCLGDKLGRIFDGRYLGHGADYVAFKNGCVGI